MDISVKTKKCKICEKVKSAENFGKHSYTKDKLDVYCKDCDREKSRQRYLTGKSIPKIIPLEKICGDCGQTKPAAEFSLKNLSPDGLLNRCRECVRIYHRSDTHHKNRSRRHRARYASDPKYRESLYISMIGWKYGVSPSDYQFLLETQKGLCTLCGESPSQGRRLHIDRDHSHHVVKNRACKKCIRGLLCDFCNYRFLPRLERHPHLQSDFVTQYLTRRPLAPIASANVV